MGGALASGHGRLSFPTNTPSGRLAVILHGQDGSPDDPGPAALASALVGYGAAVILPDFRPTTPTAFAADNGARFRTSTDLAVTATRWAMDEVAEAGLPIDRITVLGASAGGLVGLAVAQGDERLPGVTGRVDPDPEIDRYVGWNAPVFIYHPTSPFHDPPMWTMTDPHRDLGRHRRLTISFLVGGRDDRTPPWHRGLLDEFAGSVDRVSIDERPDGGHSLPVSGADLDALVACAVVT